MWVIRNRREPLSRSCLSGLDGQCAESARLELNSDFDPGREKEVARPRGPDGGASRRPWGTTDSEEKSKSEQM